ncbi:MAG: copper chaperone [Epsilonproteobacteria bacterium]|nr:MAG: copper chaperone [Campylobacterota bacterium]RLA65319.1 MAG: copper chaperone [Campylobacterota bacterium]
MNKTISFQVEGMNCNSCVSKIENVLSNLSKDVSVNLEEKKVTVSFLSEEATPMQLKKQIEQIGFKISKMTL